MTFVGTDVDGDGGKVMLATGHAVRGRRRRGPAAARGPRLVVVDGRGCASVRAGSAPRPDLRRRPGQPRPAHVHGHGRRGEPGGAGDGPRRAGARWSRRRTSSTASHRLRARAARSRSRQGQDGADQRTGRRPARGRREPRPRSDDAPGRAATTRSPTIAGRLPLPTGARAASSSWWASPASASRSWSRR